jgi:predicted methyltransferase
VELRIRRRSTLAIGLCCAVSVFAACASSVSFGATIREAVAHPDRPTDDRARDASSKPVEVLEFFGIRPGMVVLDLNAATGWYTEVLARVVGPTGRVLAHNHPGARTTLAAEDFERRYGRNRLPNVEQVFAGHNELELVPASLDAVLMSMVYHDTYWYSPDVAWGPVDRPALLADLYAALKPGGIVGVVDHHAAAGSDPAATVHGQHRIDSAVVRRDFVAAGFELAAESDVLRNPLDDYSRSVFDPALLGRTDRFVMRFRRPLRDFSARP